MSTCKVFCGISSRTIASFTNPTNVVYTEIPFVFDHGNVYKAIITVTAQEVSKKIHFSITGGGGGGAGGGGGVFGAGPFKSYGGGGGGGGGGSGQILNGDIILNYDPSISNYTIELIQGNGGGRVLGNQAGENYTQSGVLLTTNGKNGESTILNVYSQLTLPVARGPRTSSVNNYNGSNTLIQTFTANGGEGGRTVVNCNSILQPGPALWGGGNGGSGGYGGNGGDNAYLLCSPSSGGIGTLGNGHDGSFVGGSEAGKGGDAYNAGVYTATRNGITIGKAYGTGGARGYINSYRDSTGKCVTVTPDGGNGADGYDSFGTGDAKKFGQGGGGGGGGVASSADCCDDIDHICLGNGGNGGAGGKGGGMIWLVT